MGFGVLLHTQPAKLVFTGLTFHVIAAPIFEDDSPAFWTSSAILAVLVKEVP